MIPKIIHYCWFGGNELPELAQKCIESWKKYCPDYQIRRWDESNFDIECCDFVKEAYDMKKWAFVSDYARLKIIYNEGGIYLDVDVELIKNIDVLLENKCYLGEEGIGYVNTGLGFGAEKNNSVILKLIEEYEGKHFIQDNGNLDTIPCPEKNTLPIKSMGYNNCLNGIWKIDSLTIYPSDYFCPIDYETGNMCITANTYSIHHFSALWHTKFDRIILKIDTNSITTTRIEHIIRRCISFPIRIINKIKIIGLKSALILAISKLRKEK